VLLGLLGVLVSQVGEGDVLEGAHRRQHRASNPSCVPSVEVGVHGDVCVLLVRVSQGPNFIVKSLGEALHHGGSTGQNNVVIQTNFEISVTCLDGL